MQNINSTTDLKKAIQILEIEQAFNELLLTDQLNITYESFKPANLIKSKIIEMTSSTSLINNVLGATVGLATGYLTKKVFIGTSVNIFRKLFGSVLQLGVTQLVAHHPEAIKSVGQFFIEHIFRKKEINSTNK